MSSAIPDIAAHVARDKAVFTDDFLQGMLEGKIFVIGGQQFLRAASERAILKQHGFAQRPVKFWDER